MRRLLLLQRSGRVLSVPQTRGYTLGHPRRRSPEHATVPGKGVAVQISIDSLPTLPAPSQRGDGDISEREARCRIPLSAHAQCRACRGAWGLWRGSCWCFLFLVEAPGFPRDFLRPPGVCCALAARRLRRASSRDSLCFSGARSR